MPSRACGWRRCRIRERRHSRSMPRQTPLPPELGTGPFTVAEAHALGLTEGRLRCDDLTRPSYGVRRLGPTEGIAQLAEATSLVLPVGSAFSHVTAARTLGPAGQSSLGADRAAACHEAREPPGRRMGLRATDLGVGDGPSAKPRDAHSSAPAARTPVTTAPLPVPVKSQRSTLGHPVWVDLCDFTRCMPSAR